MNKWREKFINSSFDRKMQIVMTVTVTVTTFLALTISTVSSVASMRRQSVELLQSQNSTVAENYRSSLENYRTLAIATVLDSAVQQYAKADAGENGSDAELLRRNAYNILESIINMHSTLNFIALVKDGTDDYLYRGKENITITGFLQNYYLDEQKCKTVRNSSIRMCYNNAYYGGSQYTLSIYFPIYDTGKIFRELGLLCMNFSDPSLEQILGTDSSSPTELFVVDTDGMLVAAGEQERIGQYVDYMQDVRSPQGSFVKEGRLYIFQKVKDWNFYVVSSVPSMEIYSSSIRMLPVMALMLLSILFVCSRILSRIIRMMYQPLDKVVKKMDDVASGSLATRINVDNMGEDFEKLAVGFNSMMEEILVLMEQVKQEQHQIEQIRFNALQSQIQPHFLYNTLECIHWQAIADGNREISTLVKALAGYYRICLSRGQEVIPLSTELKHVKNYLIIQNMRYDNIIESVFDIESGIDDTRIPKLTLQPLVENSIYHGMKVTEGRKGTLFVKARREDETVRITVSDTGTGMDQKKIDEMNLLLKQYDDSFGYGVRNVNKRIELFYGTEYGLHFLKNEDGGLTVEIRLPYDTEKKECILNGDEYGI